MDRPRAPRFPGVAGRGAVSPPAPDLAWVFFALGDKTRRWLIAVLCASSAFSIAPLTANTHITRQAVAERRGDSLMVEADQLPRRGAG